MACPQRQAMIWTSAEILLIWPLGTNFGEILIEIHTFSFKKIHVKMLSAKRQPFRLGLCVLKMNDTDLHRLCWSWSWDCNDTELWTFYFSCVKNSTWLDLHPLIQIWKKKKIFLFSGSRDRSRQSVHHGTLPEGSDDQGEPRQTAAAGTLQDAWGM